MIEARYYVETWDPASQRFIPQLGVPVGPYSKWGLRRALRRLKDMGYTCEYRSQTGVSDFSVWVWRNDQMKGRRL